MFKIDQSTGYWRTVSFFTYAETGAPEEHQLRVKFRHLGRSQVKALFEPKEGEQLTDEDVCRRVICGIQGDGIEGGYEQILDDLMDVLNLQEVLSTEYFKSLRELREKNSPAPPATG